MQRLFSNSIPKMLVESMELARPQIKEGTTKPEAKSHEIPIGARFLLINELITKNRSDSEKNSLESEGSAFQNTLFGAEMEFCIQAVKKNNVGNCGEHCLLVIDALDKLNFKGNAEIFCVADKDDEKNNHEFVVVNREAKSDPNDIATWGRSEEIYIIDSWRHIIYPLSEIQKYLGVYIQEANEDDDHMHCSIADYNPKQHIIKIHSGFSLENLRAVRAKPELLQKKEVPLADDLSSDFVMMS